MENKTLQNEQYANSGLNAVICSALQEIWDYIENQEYNCLNGELLNLANDIQFKIEQKINELQNIDD